MFSVEIYSLILLVTSRYSSLQEFLSILMHFQKLEAKRSMVFMTLKIAAISALPHATVDKSDELFVD